ncbi:hypothetical protein AVEN_10386-1 [Araneus ventricosus]|uniref:Uncharacterized protein n=1 Tax=Araneus ventricosus TaxID=182803 RepID=A0A4Y2GZ39_ARAVE|nr:hypothetical protein AVEN_10386-1 [Araneus ventricosus]
MFLKSPNSIVNRNLLQNIPFTSNIRADGFLNSHIVLPKEFSSNDSDSEEEIEVLDATTEITEKTMFSKSPIAPINSVVDRNLLRNRPSTSNIKADGYLNSHTVLPKEPSSNDSDSENEIKVLYATTEIILKKTRFLCVKSPIVPINSVVDRNLLQNMPVTSNIAVYSILNSHNVLPKELSSSDSDSEDEIEMMDVKTEITEKTTFLKESKLLKSPIVPLNSVVDCDLLQNIPSTSNITVDSFLNSHNVSPKDVSSSDSDSEDEREMLDATTEIGNEDIRSPEKMDSSKINKLFHDLELFQKDGVLYHYYNHLKTSPDHAFHFHVLEEKKKYLMVDMDDAYIYLNERLNYHRELLYKLIEMASGMNNPTAIIREIITQSNCIRGYCIACQALVL